MDFVLTLKPGVISKTVEHNAGKDKNMMTALPGKLRGMGTIKMVLPLNVTVQANNAQEYMPAMHD